MSDLAALNITIKVSGVGEAEASFNQVKRAGKDLQRDFDTLNSTKFDALISNIQRIAAAVGGLYILEKVMSSWYGLLKNGILAVDNFQKKIIGTSYIMATMSEVPAPDLGKAYAEWTEFHKWLYAESVRVDKQSAASSGEIFAVALELEKKGVVADTQEQMETVGRFVDLMKGVIPTFASLEQQARGEIEAVLSGTTRMGAQTAQVLASIDPEFKKHIANARENNTVLKYFKSILPQIEAYTKQLMGTWDAVGASLKSAWDIVQVNAFGDAHKDVVAFATQLGNRLVDNGALTAEGTKLAEALGKAWSEAKDQATQFVDYVLNNMPEIVSNVKAVASGLGAIGSAALASIRGVAALVKELQAVSQNPVLMGILGAAAGSRFGPVGAAAGAVIGAGTAMDSRVKAAEDYLHQKEFEGYETSITEQTAGFTMPVAGAGAKAPPHPAVRPFTGKEPKGGGGGGREDAEANRLMSLFDSLTKDIARLSEGKLSEIEANYEKTLDQIYKSTEHRVVTQAELEVLNTKRKNLQKTKAEEDYELFVAKASGDQFKEIAAQQKKHLSDYKGFKNAEQNIADITARANVVAEVTRYSEITNIQITYIDAMASASPLLQDQLAWKTQSLDLDNKLALSAINKTVAENPYLAYLKDEMVSHQELVNLAKQYQLAIEKWKVEGISGGVKSYLLQAKQEMETGLSDATKKTLTDVQNTFASGFAQATVDALHGKATDFGKIFTSMFDKAVYDMSEYSYKNMFQSAATGIGSLLGFDLSGMVKPDGSSARPFYVKDVTGSLFGGKGSSLFGTGIPEVDSVTNQWNSIGNSLGSVFNNGTNALNDSSKYWQYMFGSSNQELQSNAGNYYNVFSASNAGLFNTAVGYGNVFTGAVNGLTGWANGFAGILNQFLNAMAGNKSSGLGRLLGGLVRGGIGLLSGGMSLSEASNAGAGTYSAFNVSGSGSNMAFSLIRHAGGMLYAHSGMILPRLASDEVPFIGLSGERVLNRQETADYNSGKPDVVVSPNVTVINNAKNTDSKVEQTPAGDIIVTIDELTATAYSRRGSLFKVINQGNTVVRR
jgi:hypothetical protein